MIAFNERHCPTEMKYFGQEVFRFSEDTSGDLTDPTYLAARAFSLASAGVNGIDAAIARDELDAIIAPTYSFATTPAAVAGYPDISVPVGLTPEGKPAGIWMYSGFLEEPRLLALAYDLEQAINPRRQPEMLGEEPPEPLDEGICESLPRPQIGGRRTRRITSARASRSSVEERPSTETDQSSLDRHGDLQLIDGVSAAGARSITTDARLAAAFNNRNSAAVGR